MAVQVTPMKQALKDLVAKASVGFGESLKRYGSEQQNPKIACSAEERKKEKVIGTQSNSRKRLPRRTRRLRQDPTVASLSLALCFPGRPSNRARKMMEDQDLPVWDQNYCYPTSSAISLLLPLFGSL